MNMKGEFLLIIILKCAICSGIECFVCESEINEIICRRPDASSVIKQAVYCSTEGTSNSVCSTTIYKRKCRGGGTQIKYLDWYSLHTWSLLVCVSVYFI